MGTTAGSVEVKRVKNRIYPCERCKYYHRTDFPKTFIHSIITNERRQLPVFGIWKNQSYIERLGWCENYKEKSKGE